VLAWCQAKKPATSGSSAVKLSIERGKKVYPNNASLVTRQMEAVYKYESTVDQNKMGVGRKNALITVVLKGMNRNWRSMAIRIIM